LAQRDSEIAELKAQVRWFQNQIFGRKSERRLASDSKYVQLTLGSLLEEETPATPTETVKEYQRRVKPEKPSQSCEDESGLRFSSDVPVKRFPPKPEEVASLEEGKDYEVIGEKVTHRLAQRPASYVVLKYVRPVVKLKSDKVVSHPAPSGVFDRSFADVSLVAGIMVDKFQYHLPLYWQHPRLAAGGITISRQTLTNFVARAADLLAPIYYAQLSSILQSKVLAMDETPIKAGQASKGKLHQGFFWPLYGDKDEVAFPYGATRALTQAKEILGEFAGTLVTDGYGVYSRYTSKVTGVSHATCWAHTRRKFIEAESSDFRRCQKALEYIRVLYEIEALILFATLLIAHIPAPSLAAAKKSRATFSGRYLVKTRPVRVESSNPRFDCFKAWPDQVIWKIAQKGSRVTLTAPQTITLRGQIVGPKTFTASYSQSEPADAFSYPETHSSHYYVEQAFTFRTQTSGTVKQVRIYNDSRADWEEKNGEMVEFICTEYHTGTFRKR
jgi:transposase